MRETAEGTERVELAILEPSQNTENNEDLQDQLDYFGGDILKVTSLYIQFKNEMNQSINKLIVVVNVYLITLLVVQVG